MIELYGKERCEALAQYVIETGANDVYMISLEDGKELLIPAIKECILNVDIENKKMEVHVMEGLRD